MALHGVFEFVVVRAMHMKTGSRHINLLGFGCR
jgi:hypothetical protein